MGFIHKIFQKKLDNMTLYEKIVTITQSETMKDFLKFIYVNGIERCQCNSHKDPCNGPASIVVLRKDKTLKICTKCFEKGDTIVNVIQYKEKEQIESLIIWEIATPNLIYILANQNILKE